MPKGDGFVEYPRVRTWLRNAQADDERFSEPHTGNGHRSGVSGLVRAGISFRKTKRAEKVSGFDQAPDFIVPDEFNPQVVIEAKIAEDDGTARDKVTRIQHLHSLSRQGLAPTDPPRFDVVACIGGRGFKVRREDMKKLLLSTRGRVFTLQNLDRLVDSTRLAEFRTRGDK